MKKLFYFIISIILIIIIALSLRYQSLSYYVAPYKDSSISLKNGMIVGLVLETYKIKKDKEKPFSHFQIYTIFSKLKSKGILAIKDLHIKDYKNNIINYTPLMNFSLDIGRIEYIPYVFSGTILIKNDEGDLLYKEKFSVTLEPSYDYPKYISGLDIILGG